MKHFKLLTIAALSLAALLTSAKTEAKSYYVWNDGYDHNVCEIIMGYVNKSWICTYDSGTQREDFFGDTSDKFLHGIQFGALYTPTFGTSNFGLRTGLFFESYVSRSRWITYWCHHFAEVDLYIPVQASYRIPISYECGFNLFGGASFQWAMDGKYYRQVGTVWRWWRRPIPVMSGLRHEYGNGWPEKVNWQADLGFNFYVRHFTIGFTYSFGLNDHHIQNTFDDGLTYVTAKRSRQDKMQASIAFAF